MKYSINVKYWHDGHDHEIFFHYRADAFHVFRALTYVAPNTENDIEFVSLWDDENRKIIMCVHF